MNLSGRWLPTVALAFAAVCSSARGQTDSPPTFAVIPVEGTFGEQVVAQSFSSALLTAKQDGIKYIVLRFDTPGGTVNDAEVIHELLKKYDHDFEYIGVIDEAFSAAVWLLAMCDYRFVEGYSASGAAVAYTRSADGDADAVTAKMAASIASRLASAATEHNQFGDLYYAFVVQAESLYADQSDPPRLTRRLQIGNDWRQIDGPKTVLALSAKEAIDIGWAAALPGSIEAAVRQISNAPEVADRSALIKKNIAQGMISTKTATSKIKIEQSKIAKYEKSLERTEALIPQERKRATSLDPSKLTLYYYENTGILTDSSRRRWKDQSQSAISAWNSVLMGLSQFEKDLGNCNDAIDNHNALLISRAKTRQWSDEMIRDVEKQFLARRKATIEVESLRVHANQEISRINSERNRLRID